MIQGIGIDIVELKRIEKAYERNEKFAERILTANELAVFNELQVKRKIEFLAGRFAVKEAYSKAFGTGIGKELSFQDIEVVKDELGKPFILKEGCHVHVSISHSNDYAVAQVIIERKES
ncbi:MAG: holo-ACP synthase [Bacillaceae bacterium]